METLILVTENDEQIGTAQKQEAHEKALLHRAFSIIIFRDESETEILIQQRHPDKYHCGGLWTNSCCSHPRDGEATLAAAHRRLQEELGFDTELSHKGHFIYKAAFENGLTEHELDHVFVGYYNGPIPFNTSEIAGVKWLQTTTLKEDLNQNPNAYTPWFSLTLEQITSR